MLDLEALRETYVTGSARQSSGAVATAVFPWRHAAFAFEKLCQVALVPEPGFHGDVCKQFVGCLQQSADGVQSDSGYVVARGNAESAAELTAKVDRRGPDHGGEAVDCYVVGVVCVYILRNGLEATVPVGGAIHGRCPVIQAGGADEPPVLVEQWEDALGVAFVRLVGRVAVSDGDERSAGLAHGLVQRNVVVGEGAGEQVVTAPPDGFEFVMDVAEVAVAPVQGHDASVRVLHVECDIRHGIHYRLEHGSVYPHLLEEGRLGAFPLSLCHDGTHYTTKRYRRVSGFYIFIVHIIQEKHCKI